MAESSSATSPIAPAASGGPQVNPLSLGIEEVAKVLSAGGGRKVMVEQVKEDIAAGAPVGADGRMNLVAYAAWLMKENQRKTAERT